VWTALASAFFNLPSLLPHLNPVSGVGGEMRLERPAE
jgi:hypothetical protein